MTPSPELEATQHEHEHRYFPHRLQMPPAYEYLFIVIFALTI